MTQNHSGGYWAFRDTACKAYAEHTISPVTHRAGGYEIVRKQNSNPFSALLPQVSAAIRVELSFHSNARNMGYSDDDSNVSR